jgi:hypothetical protein
MPAFQLARPIGAVAIVTTLCACGYAGDDEVDVESAAILARVPVGTPFMELSPAMQKLGFTCIMRRRQFTDAKGNVTDSEPHLSCHREQTRWLVCSRRTRAVLLQQNGKLSDILVNVGSFCS